MRELLDRRFGLVLDARRAGSVEMVRERALLDQKPQFLWPSSSVLVEVARNSGLKLSRDQVIFTSPIVLYSWDRIAEGLVKGGFAQPAGGPRYTIDLEKLLRAIIAGESWAKLGVPDLFGRARVVSTDPSKSNSGFMFAGLAANLLSGDVVTLETLGRAMAMSARSLNGWASNRPHRASCSTITLRGVRRLSRSSSAMRTSSSNG